MKKIGVSFHISETSDEPTDFMADLSRMYALYAEKHQPNDEIVSFNKLIWAIFSAYIRYYLNPYVYSSLESNPRRFTLTTHATKLTIPIVAALVMFPEVGEYKLQLNLDDWDAYVFSKLVGGVVPIPGTIDAVGLIHRLTRLRVTTWPKGESGPNRHWGLKLSGTPFFESLNLIEDAPNMDEVRSYNFKAQVVIDKRLVKMRFPLRDVLDGDLDPLINAIAQRTNNLPSH